MVPIGVRVFWDALKLINRFCKSQLCQQIFYANKCPLPSQFCHSSEVFCSAHKSGNFRDGLQFWCLGVWVVVLGRSKPDRGFVQSLQELASAHGEESVIMVSHRAWMDLAEHRTRYSNFFSSLQNFHFRTHTHKKLDIADSWLAISH